MPSKSSGGITKNYSGRGKRTKARRVKESRKTIWYEIPYPASAYTFPKDAFIHQVRFDEKFLSIELTDGRILSIPLSWIPSLQNADPKEIAKYRISRDRTEIIWDPDKCAINDEVRVKDYLGPCRKED